MFNPQTLKNDFPIFKHRPDLVYLDSAATAQKPQVVLEAIRTYYEEYCSNVSRGLYPLAEMATLAIGQAREHIAEFIGSDPDHTIFVANATHGINLVATGLREHIKPGANIVVTAIEHHSNFLPWKELALRTGATFRIAPPDINGYITKETILPLIDKETRVLALSVISNVLGIINPIQSIIQAVREKNPKVLILVDACQAVGHISVSLKEWDADYLVFSGHKIYGPTGIGVLAGKQASLELLGAVNVGGGTVLDPLSSPVRYKQLPDMLEGGTPNIAGIIGLGAAIQFIERIGLNEIRAHEQHLTAYTLRRLQEEFGTALTIVGTTELEAKSGIISFTIKGIHPHDVASLLGEREICVRAGLQCASPLHASLALPASTRLSFSLFTTEQDIEKLILALKEIQGIL